MTLLLAGTLNISEFRKAFSKYRNIICEVYPFRRPELNSYADLIDELHQKYGGNGFYEYHNTFSRKAAQYLIQHNIVVDWSSRDTELFLSIFSGRKTELCMHCNSTLHSSNICPANLTMPGNAIQSKRNNKYSNFNAANHTSMDRRGRQIISLNGKQICNNFNETQCSRLYCNLLHVCKLCKNDHPQSTCEQRDKNEPH